jgi:1-phosphatidylinositol phosphodiesterase
MSYLKILFGYVLIAILTLSTSPLHASNGVEWMKKISDTSPIGTLSIPGTHDSGAMKGGRVLQTQTNDLRSQLEMGIRAFDIRLAERKGKLGLFHSRAFQNIYWEDQVLPLFIAFLQEHPSETLIVSLKCEDGRTKPYASLLSASLAEEGNQSYFITNFSPDLTLKECRGKILFLLRDPVMEHYPGALCCGWQDNASCVLTLLAADGTQVKALLQDEYEYQSVKEAYKKRQACITHFKRLQSELRNSQWWGISFVSATAKLAGTPVAFADKLNLWIANDLRSDGHHYYGIVFIDFASSESGQRLVNYLIDSNTSIGRL